MSQAIDGGYEEKTLVELADELGRLEATADHLRNVIRDYHQPEQSKP